MLVALAFAAMLLFGCTTVEDDAQGAPEVEEPTPGTSITIEEEVVVPAHEPPPPPEPEPEPQGDILTEHKDTEHFLHGRPDQGDILTTPPRKVNVVFNYPMTVGSRVEVWDENEVLRYDEGKTILADTDLLVAIVYLRDMEPGTYKVKYYAVFAGKKEEPEEGYYYFRFE